MELGVNSEKVKANTFSFEAVSKIACAGLELLILLLDQVLRL